MPDVYRSAAARAEVRRWCEQRLERWTTPHERAVVDTSLGTTHLLRAGSGASTVLYLPGTNFNAATSLPLLTALAGSGRVVAADVPGQPGLSAGERPAGDRYAAYGGWVGELVRHLRAEQLVLAGHSLGAAIALSAETAGVTGLLLLDPAGLVRLRVEPRVLLATLPWLLRPTPGRSARLLRHMHGSGRRPAEDAVAWLTLVARATRTSGAPGPLPPATLRRWGGVPRTVLSGAQDCFLPVRPLRRAVRERLGAELRVLDGAGHLTPDEEPDRIVAAAAELVDEAGGGR